MIPTGAQPPERGLAACARPFRIPARSDAVGRDVPAVKGYDSNVEHDRFDDVEFRVMERPDPPRRPRMRRWVLALRRRSARACALRGGRLDLGGGEDQQAREAAPPKPRTNIMYTDRGTPYARDGRDCEDGRAYGGRHKRERRTSELRH